MQLSEGAWLEFEPHWLLGHEELFETLRTSTAWRAHERVMYERTVAVPRLTARVELQAGGMNPQPITAAVGAPSPKALEMLAQIAEHLSQRYGRRLTSIGLSYYRNGQDSVAPHGDKMGALVDDTVLAILSLGGPRRMNLTPNKAEFTGSMPRSQRFNLGQGDLLILGGNCQRSWLHGIPKVPTAAPRISVVFREEVPGVQQEPEWLKTYNKAS